MRIAAAVLSLLATGCVHCVTFDKLPTGTMWQAPSQSPGDLVHTESGIRVMVDRHQWTSGSSAFNLAQVESGWAPRGNHVHTNNMNLTFDFGELGTGKKEITLRFRDMGGAENFSVNGGPVTRGELSSGSEAGIVHQDRDVMRRLGIDEGATLEWDDIVARIASSVAPDDLDSICGNCPWLPLGVCKTGIAALRAEAGG